jgi:hypothetical protein
VVQDEEVSPRAGRDRVGATLIVAEFHEQSLVVKPLDDGAILPARKSPRGRASRQKGGRMASSDRVRA